MLYAFVNNVLSLNILMKNKVPRKRIKRRKNVTVGHLDSERDCQKRSNPQSIPVIVYSRGICLQKCFA